MEWQIIAYARVLDIIDGNCLLSSILYSNKDPLQIERSLFCSSFQWQEQKFIQLSSFT